MMSSFTIKITENEMNKPLQLQVNRATAAANPSWYENSQQQDDDYEQEKQKN